MFLCFVYIIFLLSNEFISFSLRSVVACHSRSVSFNNVRLWSDGTIMTTFYIVYRHFNSLSLYLSFSLYHSLSIICLLLYASLTDGDVVNSIIFPLFFLLTHFVLFFLFSIIHYSSLFSQSQSQHLTTSHLTN